MTSKLKRKSIRTYFQERCSKVTDSKTFWNTIRPYYSSKGFQTTQNIQLLEDDGLVTEPTAVANIFNDYYTTITSNIGTPVNQDEMKLNDEEYIRNSKEKHKNHPSVTKILENHGTSGFSFQRVSVRETEKILKEMDAKKATGFDFISPRIVQMASPILSAPMAAIVNTCLKTSQFPLDLKKAEVGPEFKKDGPMGKKNHRPVSILTGISKVVEKCFNSQLSSFCQMVLLQHLSTYRKGYSCQYRIRIIYF